MIQMFKVRLFDSKILFSLSCFSSGILLGVPKVMKIP